jgi:hypothetical protein
MTLVTAPNIIEQSDFSMGHSPQGEDASTDASALLDCLNLILDKNTGSLITRGGFQRDWLLTGISDLNDHWVTNVYAWGSPQGSKLMVIVTDGSASADNVGLILVDLEANSYGRIDTAGRTWANPKEHHWGVGMEGIWYGGVIGEPMYSYNDFTNTWDADAGVPAGVLPLIDDVNDGTGIAPGIGYARDHAFKGDEIVSFDGAYYRPARSIRFDEFDNDENVYQVGDKVSRIFVWASTNIYWKSFKCIQKHDPDTVDADPGTGADWRDYWTKVRLPLPNNSDDGNETSSSWYFVPDAAETSIAAWHANRLFLRWDDEGDRSRLQFSAPVKPEKGEDIPDVVWSPDFAPGNSILGAGGGWLPFNDGTHHGFITALRSYGDRLLVFKRQAVWALVGTDDSTWQTKRIIEGIGAVGPQSHCAVDGMVYFLSDEGLYVTDGQEAREVPGNERYRDYIRTRLDESQFVQSTGVRRVDQYPVVWPFDGFIWISMPSDENSTDKYVTLAYHVETGSWYYTNLPVKDTAFYRETGKTLLSMVPPPSYGELDGAGTVPKLYQYIRTLTADADGLISEGSSDIAWRARFGWWSFSTLREERRIRRVWALLRAATSQTISIVARRNYSDTAVATTTRTALGATPTHYEGEVIQDSHAVSYEVSGTKAGAAVFGFAVQTQPRRTRYHTG